MKKLGLVAAAAVAVLALAGCQNGVEEVKVVPDSQTSNYTFDVSGTATYTIAVAETTTYNSKTADPDKRNKTSKWEGTEKYVYTADDSSLATITWTTPYYDNSNSKGYSVSLSGLGMEYTYPDVDADGKQVTSTKTNKNADDTLNIVKLGDEYYVRNRWYTEDDDSRFAGNAGLIPIDETDLEDDEVVISFTRTYTSTEKGDLKELGIVVAEKVTNKTYTVTYNYTLERL